jgi:hypothetical protein
MGLKPAPWNPTAIGWLGLLFSPPVVRRDGGGHGISRIPSMHGHHDRHLLVEASIWPRVSDAFSLMEHGTMLARLVNG